MKGPLAGVAELIRREAGISLSDGRAAALQAAIRRAAPGLDADSLLLAAAHPSTGPDLVERLIDEVTVQESSFLRDPAQLEGIAWRRLGRQATGKIRVWSAGCAGGEEAYTLALLATEAFAPGTAPVDILGTDISHTALATAAAGRYRERAVRGVGGMLRRRYLDKLPDGTSQVGQELRALVRFKYHNMARDAIPPAGETGFDLIVCRNVLIYFAIPVVARVSQLMEQALRPSGLLVFGAADVLCRTAALGAPVSAAPPRTPASGEVPGAQPQSAREQAAREQAAREQAARTGPAGPGSRPQAASAQPPPAGSSEQRLRHVLDTAAGNDRDQALQRVASLVADDPLDADAQFLYGLLALEAGEPARARDALRSALFTDPAFGLAAFALGRAFDALGEGQAARRAYERALRTLDPGDNRHEAILQQIDLGDIAAACRARLDAVP